MRIIQFYTFCVLAISEVQSTHEQLPEALKPAAPETSEVVDESWKNEGFFKGKDVCTLNERRAIEGDKNATNVYNDYIGSGKFF